MALTNLPPELLDMIVEYSLPQSFESLATTCKRIYARCIPFIKHHNQLRSRFRAFAYYAHPRDSLVAASDLISLIAADPIIARHIRIANLVHDSRFLLHVRARYDEPPKFVPSIEEGGAIVQLFANSTHLRRARLDWREYYSSFAEDVREMRYSQHGSAFLLTLLPDTEDLTMPCFWKPNAATSQLLDVLVKEATESSSMSSGLRSATSLLGSLSTAETENWGLSWASPFLALPHMKSFGAPYSFAAGAIPRTLAFRGSPYIAETLEAAHLAGCCIDHVGITDFLKHTPRLKTLKYSHRTHHAFLPPDWDICKFINAIAAEAGSHLEELSVKIHELRGSILPGKASTRRFQRLEKFEFPLEVVMCNINAAGVTGNIATSLQRFFNGSLDPFVRDLIPTSVTHLSLKSDGRCPHDQALGALFRHFRAVHRCQLPNLQDVHIACKQEADKAYKQQCNKMVAEGDRAGVLVYLQAFGESEVNWDK